MNQRETDVTAALARILAQQHTLHQDQHGLTQCLTGAIERLDRTLEQVHRTQANMETLTPDELNALGDIPEDTYVTLAEAVLAEYHPITCVAMDREVLKRWYASQAEDRHG